MSKRHVLSWGFIAALAVIAPVGDDGDACAATRVTPPVFVPSGGSMVCAAVNLSTAPHQVTIEVLDVQGDLVPSANANCSATNPRISTVSPGAVSPIGCAGSGYRYCRSTIKGAGRGSLRGALRAMDGASETIAILPAD